MQITEFRSWNYTKKADQILYGVKQQCKGTFRIVNAEEEKTAEQE